MFGAFFITQFQCSVVKVIEIGPIQNGVPKSGLGFGIRLLPLCWCSVSVLCVVFLKALASAERARRTAEQERDDLQDEASSSGPKV